MNILINNKEVDFSENDFPVLIHGYPKTGASYFSVCLSANLLNNNRSILFFSAYPAAKEELRKEINNDKNNAVIIDSGEENVLIETLKNTPDIHERIVLIKNIENYSHKLFEIVKDLNLIVFSGNLDKCVFANELIKREVATKIFFSKSERCPQRDLENLEKYTAKIFSDKYSGIVSLDK